LIFASLYQDKEVRKKKNNISEENTFNDLVPELSRFYSD
jgi:hypothetical protein